MELLVMPDLNFEGGVNTGHPPGNYLQWCIKKVNGLSCIIGTNGYRVSVWKILQQKLPQDKETRFFMERNIQTTVENGNIERSQPVLCDKQKVPLLMQLDLHL
jgi:hypothetical protein